VYGSYWKTVIIVYKVINMDIFKQRYITSLQKVFINPLDHFYDGWMHFFGLTQVTIHSHYKAWKGHGTNITPIVFG